MGRHNMNRCQWRGRNKCQSAGAPGPVLSICLAVKRTFNLIHASNPSPEWKYELSFQPSQLDRSEHETHVAGMPIHLPEGRIPASISLSLSLSISLLISIFFFNYYDYYFYLPLWLNISLLLPVLPCQSFIYHRFLVLFYTHSHYYCYYDYVYLAFMADGIGKLNNNYS